MDQPELRVRRRGFLGGDPFDADHADHDDESAEGVRVRTRRVRRRPRSLTSRHRSARPRPSARVSLARGVKPRPPLAERRRHAGLAAADGRA